MTCAAGLTVQAATRLQALMLRAKAVSVAVAAAEPEEGACTDVPVKEPHLDIVATGVAGVRRQPTLGCRQNTQAQNTPNASSERTHTHLHTYTHTQKTKETCWVAANQSSAPPPAAFEETSCIVEAHVSHDATAATHVGAAFT